MRAVGSLVLVAGAIREPAAEVARKLAGCGADCLYHGPVSLTKRAMEEAEARLFWPSGRVVCTSHVVQLDLASWVEPSGAGGECSVCGSRTDAAIDLDSLLDLIVSVIRCYRRRAIDDLYHDSETESGYATASVSFTDEVVWDLTAGDLDDELSALVASEIEDDQWYDPSTLWLSGRELLVFSWQQFSAWALKNGPFLDSLADEGEDLWAGEAADGIPPSRMLQRLSRLVADLGLVRVIDVDVPWYRAVSLAPHEMASVGRLGTVPLEYATRSNRMTPAGTPMFYGARDEATARLEMGAPPSGERAVVGRWVPTRPLHVLDLTELPPAPSFYDVERADERQALMFLEHFAGEVSQPLEAGADAMVAYRPTQAFTARAREDLGVDGIVYHSSLNNTPCCVLFVVNQDCVETADAKAFDGSLQLVLQGHSDA